MFQVVMLSGGVANSPTIKNFHEKEVCNFNLETVETWKRQDGEYSSRKEVFKIVAYDEMARECHERLSIGSQVYVTGKLRTRKWEQDGKPFSVQEIVVKSIDIPPAPSASTSKWFHNHYKQTPPKQQQQQLQLQEEIPF